MCLRVVYGAVQENFASGFGVVEWCGNDRATPWKRLGRGHCIAVSKTVGCGFESSRPAKPKVRGGRVVDCGGLENRCLNGLRERNPPLRQFGEIVNYTIYIDRGDRRGLRRFVATRASWRYLSSYVQETWEEPANLPGRVGRS